MRLLARYTRATLRSLRRKLPAPDEALVSLRGGYAVTLRPNSDKHERELYFERTYEPATLAFFDETLREGDIMVDVGANLGVMSLHASRRVGPSGRVIALEPHPSYFTRLSHHVQHNAATNVTAIQMAAGEREEALPIYDVPSVNIGRSSLIKPAKSGRLGPTVNVRRLDDILAAAGVSTVRLLKIDVEGFELSVLKGAQQTLSRTPAICMEVTSEVDKADPLEAHDFLMSLGTYRACRFDQGKGYAFSRLVPVSDRTELTRQRHDNIIYLPVS